MQVLILLIIIIVIIIYYNFFGKVEKMDNIPQDKLQLVIAIKTFITPSSTYGDYIDMLKENKNTSLNATTNESFSELRFISKNRVLTNNDILNYLTDI